MKKEDCVIVDLEGTLSDCSKRIHYLANKNYNVWNGLFPDDEVNEKFRPIMDKLISSGTKMVLLTAKSIKYKEDVFEWLAANGLKANFYEFHFRLAEDERPSVALKEELLARISANYNVIRAYDDRIDIRQMFRKHGIEAPDWNGAESGDIKKTIVWSPPSVGKTLTDAADFFTERSKEYGDAYKRHGNIMAAFFPEGITLKTPEDFFMYHLFELDVVKSNRLAENINHKDSWHDKMVYSAMAKTSIEEK